MAKPKKLKKQPKTEEKNPPLDATKRMFDDLCDSADSAIEKSDKRFVDEEQLFTNSLFALILKPGQDRPPYKVFSAPLLGKDKDERVKFVKHIARELANEKDFSVEAFFIIAEAYVTVLEPKQDRKEALIISGMDNKGNYRFSLREIVRDPKGLSLQTFGFSKDSDAEKKWQKQDLVNPPDIAREKWKGKHFDGGINHFSDNKTQMRDHILEAVWREYVVAKMLAQI